MPPRCKPKFEYRHMDGTDLPRGPFCPVEPSRCGHYLSDMTDSPDIIRSALCRSFTSDGLTVQIEIYRLRDSDSWTLELVDDEGDSIVWEEQFATDAAAFAEFTEGLEELGLEKLIAPDEEDTATVH